LRHLPDKILTEINAVFTHTDTTLKEIEKTAILAALRKNNWRKLKTAQELGINKNTLRRKIVAYNIEENSSR
jgi:transcriptional regulator of acetoin/glycerol metabolism